MNLYNLLQAELKKENNFVDDNGELKKFLVLDKAQNFDEELIEHLLNNDATLAWPFKDCVLGGAQSSEEKRKDEIFFNELLAQDEITQLFEPKVLTNAKRY